MWPALQAHIITSFFLAKLFLSLLKERKRLSYRLIAASIADLNAS